MQKLKEYRKLAVVVLLASVLTAAPIAVIASAQNTDDPNPVLEVINEEPTEEQPTEEEEAPPPEEETPPPTEDPEVPAEENEEPVEEPEVTPVTILEAIAIAQAAHDEVAGKTSEVIKAQVKLKKLNGEKVYKVVFRDGWRIYVQAANGEIVLMKDKSNKKRECGDRGRRAVAAWQNSFKKKWGFHPTRHYDSKPKNSVGWWNGRGWQKPGQQHDHQRGGHQPERDNEQEQPAETEGQTVEQ